MPRLVRLALVFVLAATLAVPVLSAAPAAGAEPRPGLLVSLWSLLTGLWSDNGCEVDPSGRCLVSQGAAATGDNGCSADPDGHCLAGQGTATTSDNGCEADPNGRCIG